jgi:hypothetical protein
MPTSDPQEHPHPSENAANTGRKIPANERAVIRALFSAPSFPPPGLAIPGEIMVFPAGVHEIHASRDDKPATLTVRVTPDTALAMQTALEGYRAAAVQRPFFDFAHDNKAASAWPLSYRWETGSSGKPPGVYAAVDWSEAGRASIQGKTYRTFSPAFFIDDDDPASVTGAPLNMGGLVNDPAFESQAPIWAARNLSDPADPSAQPDLNHNQNASIMKNIALALGLAEDATEEQLLAAIASIKGEGKDTAALEAALNDAKSALAVQAKAAAASRVAAAVAAGRLPAKNAALLAKWTAAIEADPKHAELLDAMPVMAAAAAGDDTQKPLLAARDNLAENLRAYKAASPAERAVIYARHVREPLAKGLRLGPVLAAHDLGTLASDLVIPRAFDLLREQYPWLEKITTDFSDQNANFGQTIVTRAKTPLAASDYVPGTGYTNADALTPDIEITINAHKGVQVKFNVNELSSTTRDLFGEQSEGMAAGLGDALASAVHAVITAGNFPLNTATAAGTATRATMTALAKELTKKKVPMLGRLVLLNMDCFETLGNDPAIVALATHQRAELIEEFTLPRVAGLQPYGTNLFPTATTAGTLQGFAGTPASLALATRVPNDYSGDGAISTVRTDMGITVQKVEFADHNKAEKTVRVALMFGAAKGVADCGRRLTIAA